MKVPVLLRHMPRLRSRPVHYPAIPEKRRHDYPALAEDFTVLDDTVGDEFRDTDLEAIRQQNSYRRQQVGVLVGSVVLSALASVQALLPDQRWPGIAVTVLAAILLCSSRINRELNVLDGFLAARLRAERLRSLQFQFLSRTGLFARPDPRDTLRHAVAEIRAGREPE